MNTQEFREKLENKLLENNIQERNSKNIEKPTTNYYFQCYDAINMMHNAETFDIEGGQVWITVPLNKNLFVQLNLRLFDMLKFRANPDIQTDSITGNIFFIYKWQNLLVSHMNIKHMKEKSSAFRRYKECINDAMFCKYHHYSPSDDFIDWFLKLIQKTEKWISDNEFQLNCFDGLQLKNVKELRKTFKTMFKDSIKETFGKEFVIR